MKLPDFKKKKDYVIAFLAFVLFGSTHNIVHVAFVHYDFYPDFFTLAKNELSVSSVLFPVFFFMLLPAVFSFIFRKADFHKIEGRIFCIIMAGFILPVFDIFHLIFKIPHAELPPFTQCLHFSLVPLFIVLPVMFYYFSKNVLNFKSKLLALGFFFGLVGFKITTHKVDVAWQLILCLFLILFMIYFYSKVRFSKFRLALNVLFAGWIIFILLAKFVFYSIWKIKFFELVMGFK